MITDQELEDAFYHWLDHYKRVGYRHYSDTPEFRLVELYWDNILERIFEDLPEMTDEENKQIEERLANIF